MDRVLVTGASGFIGSHLIPRLRDEGHEVFEANRKSGDVADDSTWKSFPAADVVVHLAGRSFVPDSWADPAAFMRTNLLGTVGALEYCRIQGARLVFLSSYMYGVPERLPIPENAPLLARNPYALSKKVAEDACVFFANNMGIDVTILRPFNVYGPLQSDDFLIPGIVKQAISGSEIHVKDLAPRRDYVYVRDVVEAVVKACAWQGSLGVFNIGSGVSHSVAEVVQAIQEVWGTSLVVHSEEERRKDEIMETVADVSNAERALGWTPRFSLRQGLKDMRRASAVRSA